jgi:ABC-type multidrug transport system permease subunit
MVFGFSYFAFGVIIQGSLLALFFVFLAGIAAFSGIAILMSSRAQKTQVGNGLINAVVLPMTILSGIFFSYQNFPDWAVSIIRKLPLTLLADAIRAIFNEGANFYQVADEISYLLIIGIVLFVTGLRIYKWY